MGACQGLSVLVRDFNESTHTDSGKEWLSLLGLSLLGSALLGLSLVRSSLLELFLLHLSLVGLSLVGSSLLESSLLELSSVVSVFLAGYTFLSLCLDYFQIDLWTKSRHEVFRKVCYCLICVSVLKHPFNSLSNL